MIETNDGDAWYPQIAVDAVGNVVAVWPQYDGVRHLIWANRYVVGSGWGTAELIETNPGDASDSQVAVDPAGEAIAVWQLTNGLGSYFPGYDIYANRYVHGVGWGTPTLLETDDSTALSPQIAVDASGNGIAVWQQANGTQDPPTQFNIWARRYAAGVGWGAPTLLETNGGDDTRPQIDIDPAGNAIVVWEQYDGIANSSALASIHANRYLAGVGWGTDTVLTTEAAAGPQVAMDSQGNAFAVWDQYGAGGTTRADIYADRFTVGSGWGAPTAVEASADDSMYPEIAADSMGNAMAVWTQAVRHGTTDGPYQIYSSRFVVGTGWGTASPVENNGSSYASYTVHPQVAVDPMGNAVAVWSAYDSPRIHVYANRFVPGTGWGTPTLLDTTQWDADSPQVVMDSSGNGTAVWRSMDGVRFNIMASRFVDNGAPPEIVLTAPTETLTRESSVTAAGRTNPGVAVTVNGIDVIVNPDGSFSTPVALSEGPNTILAVATDSRARTASATRSIVRDSTPAAISITSPVDRSTTNAPSIVVIGSTEPGAHLVVDGLATPVAPDGSFSARLSLHEGTNEILATATDAAGNAASDSVTVIFEPPTGGTPPRDAGPSVLLMVLAAAILFAVAVAALWKKRRRRLDPT